MTANYIEKKDIIEEENKLYNTEQENIYPKFYNSHKLNIIQKKKEQLNNSLLFNKSSSFNVSGGDEKNRKNNDLLLPRIPSADSRKKDTISDDKNKKDLKRNLSTFQIKKNKNKYLPPKPSIIYNKDSKYNTEFNKLKKENEYMITELERLNIELRSLINKQMPFLNIKKRYNTEEKRLDMNKENEKKANKKYLHTLITEYNRIYKNLSIGQDRNIINNLEKKLNTLKNNYNDNKQTNKVLKDQVYKNEQLLENTKKIRKNQIINLNDSENKYILYKKKLEEINKENERMSKLLIDEDKKIDELKMSYSKLEEILNYYEETEESIKKKSDEEIKNKQLAMKLRKLIKKKEILIHARLTMEKNYLNKIDKQKKYINELNSSLNELNREIKLLSE